MRINCPMCSGTGYVWPSIGQGTANSQQPCKGCFGTGVQTTDDRFTYLTMPTPSEQRIADLERRIKELEERK